ncbi:LacI family DNA-binding transcriptional regulator [Ideonella sp. 4Y16]|nr:LacI family DNA-binding transcriptional regulator [Ideonella alba]
MTDVAKAAGVSQSTVSMVLNNASGARLSAETRARVLQEAMALGYRLPHRDPSLPTGPTKQQPVIGYLVDEISTSPHPVVSLDGARDAAWEQGCVLQVAVTRSNPEQENATIAAMLNQPGLVGVVYSTIFTRPVEVPEALLARPLVLLNCHDDRRRLPAVVPSEVAGGHAATEYLIAQGHTRIAFINGEPWMEAAQDRLKGYRRALATADLPFDPQLLREGDWMSGSGYEQALALMALPRPPSAIFCANDLMALGALEALKHLGLRVPADVSVIGYDDQEISRHTHPPLTTLVLPNEEMGRTAVELLLSLAAGERLPRALTKIAGPVVVRESVAGPARTAG